MNFITAIGMCTSLALVSVASANSEGAMHGAYGSYSMSRDSSGTSWQPDAAAVEGIHRMGQKWMLMAHGWLSGVYTDQGGPRGDSQLFNESMFMAMGRRAVGADTLGLRMMISAEPADGPSGYPLLFQTGETANGRDPLLDRQHPHNLLMELSGSYSRMLSASRSIYIYGGPIAEPALGPPAFMHRASGQDNPDAPLTHHWLDSTHIAFGVLTVGAVLDKWKLEVSSFNGREPNEHRYDVQLRSFDSAAVRLSFNPSVHWSLQASSGRLASPEQLEPEVAVRRTTVSAIYDRAFETMHLQTLLAWGRNVPSDRPHTDGYLLESAIRLGRKHTIFARAEHVMKDELFDEGSPMHGQVFDIEKLSVGYVFEFMQLGALRFGLGGAYAQHWTPAALDASYSRNPSAWNVLVRARLAE